jgi:hypothetical protein
MEDQNRRTGRNWATDQLLSKTPTPISAVQWNEVRATDTTEVEVGVRGQHFSRAIANRDLEEGHRRSALEEVMAGLAREIAQPLSPLGSCWWPCFCRERACGVWLVFHAGIW